MITWNVHEVTEFFGTAPERPYGEDTQAVFAFDTDGNCAKLTVQPYNKNVILTIARTEEKEAFAELTMDCESIEIQAASDPEQSDFLLLRSQVIGRAQHWIRITSIVSTFVIESNVGLDESDEIIQRPRPGRRKSQIGCVGIILILLILLLVATVLLNLIGS